jgi:serine/threonine protein kinase/tetratricopeptide (TPR) repeat protein
MQPRAISSNKPDATQWQRALTLLDRVLEKTATERAPLLEEIESTEPEITPLLRKLLAAQARIETRDFLSTLPKTASLNIDAGAANARIGPFLLLEQIGSGGMGSVWKARYADENIKREVAVKLPALSADSTQSIRLRERFARERDFLAQLEHANIARLYDAGISEAGHPYLALEYVRGERIDEHCDAKKLSIDERLRLFLQALDAVEFAHRQLVLHRDIKPGNILVDGQGNVKLLDFGVAKLLPNNLHTPPKYDNLTELVGTAITLAYAAPEQIVNGPLSTATDVYALGVVLFKLLTGNAPYAPSRDTRGALEEAVINALPPTLSSVAIGEADATARRATPAQLRQRLRGDLEVIVAKALRKSVTERYATAASFGDDLRRAIANEPIAARPQTLSYRANRLFARHKVAVMVSALGLSALVGTTCVAVWQASVANANAVRATKEAQRVLVSQKFMAGLFSNADPETGDGDRLTAKQILEKGRESAERELQNDAETLSMVLSQIGDIYYKLGLPEQHLELQKRRVAILESHGNPEINGMIDAQLSLGKALGEIGDAANTALSLDRLLNTLERAQKHGADAERITRTFAFIADRHRLDRRFEPAEEFIRQAVRTADENQLPQSWTLAEMHSIDAVIARDQGKFDVARKAFERSLDVSRSGRGHNRIEQIDTLNHYAQMEFDSSDFLAAKKRALDAIELASMFPGEIGNNLAPTRRLAVLATLASGDLVAAKDYAKTLLVPEMTSKSTMRRGLAALVNASIAMAERDFAAVERALEPAEVGLQTNVLLASRAARLNAELELRRNNAQDALEILTALLDEETKKFGVDHVALAPVHELLGIAYAKLNNFGAARTHFATACERYARIRQANHPLRVRCAAYLILAAGPGGIKNPESELIALGVQLANGRKDNLPLLQSMRDAQTYLGAQREGNPNRVLFPVL